ncbi:MAG: peptide deformylase, partial [Actinobacteria bacterium]|nr:peptide deformylase [Actinomycetota bacterium]
MTVRPVVALPNRILKMRAVDIGGEPDARLAQDLIETMRSAPACVGLAAPQIGVAKRAFVVDVSDHPKTTTCHGLVVLFDPVISSSAGAKLGREGCMSVPDLTANVMRAAELVVRGISPE